MTRKIPRPDVDAFAKTGERKEKALERATRSDFQQIFTEDMAGLHLLAWLQVA